MNEADALDIVQAAIWTVLAASGPAVVAAMIVGLVVALVQALTQVQEITLTFVPKILAVMAISGAVAGLGGASQIGDFSHVLDASPQGLQGAAYGYTGIVVAALGRYNPFAVFLVGVLVGGLQNAGLFLQGADFPIGLVGVIQGIILFCVLGGELLVRYRVRLGRRPVSVVEAS